MLKVRILTLVGALALLASCQNKLPDADFTEFKGLSAEQVYEKASSQLHARRYLSAAKAYEAYTALYPFSPQAEQARIDLIFAHYSAGNLPEAVAAADHFIRLYPASARIDYVYYLRGIANFKPDRGPVQNAIRLDEAERDTGTQLQAYSDFATVTYRFPHSRYAPDARQRMIHLRNAFARHELHIARFYFDRGAYVASANRAAAVIEHFQKAPETTEALNILSQSYQRLGLSEQAATVQSVIKANN